MKLEEAFERIVVINLAFKEDRRRRLEEHLIDRKIADPKNVRWERAICGNRTPPPLWWGAGNGAWGCLMSHLRIAQDAVHDNLASYCVLEDDAVFHSRAPDMLESFMKELPLDWGQAYLGGQFLHQVPERINDYVVRPYNVNRTHAFALSRQAIPKFIQHIMHAPDYFDMAVDDQGATALAHNCFHIDHQLGRAHERRIWDTYAPTWWIAGQQDGRSSISGRLNPQLWWHWRERGYMLPFFYLPQNSAKSRRNIARRYLHVGYNTNRNTLVDVGLNKKLTDEELVTWLQMIAGEAIERWMLPGFEVPKKDPNLPDRVRKLWGPGLLPAHKFLLTSVADYPFNGFCNPSPLHVM